MRVFGDFGEFFCRRNERPEKFGPHVVVWGLYGDEILPSDVGIIKHEIRIHMKQPVFHGKYRRFFFVVQMTLFHLLVVGS